MKKAIQVSSVSIIVVLLITGIFFLANFIQSNGAAQELVEQLGIFGIFILALIGGFNIFIPIHAAAFTPIFIAAGFSLPVIIATLAIGTTTADLISFWIGKVGKDATEERYPKIHKKIHEIASNHRDFVIPGVFLYSAFVPFPNEALLIPLGLAGFKLRTIVIPLLLGTVVNQVMFTLGFSSLFNVFFG